MYRNTPFPDDLDSTFKTTDLNRDGYISYCAFIGALMPSGATGNSCKVAFSILDRGKDGCADCADAAAVIGEEEGSETCRSILADIAPDGWLSWPGLLSPMAGGLLS